MRYTMYILTSLLAASCNKATYIDVDVTSAIE